MVILNHSFQLMWGWLKTARKTVIPTEQEYNFSEAKKLVESLTTRFTEEEQTEMLYQIHKELKAVRISQIEKKEKELQALRADLHKLNSFCE